MGSVLFKGTLNKHTANYNKTPAQLLHQDVLKHHLYSSVNTGASCCGPLGVPAIPTASPTPAA